MGDGRAVKAIIAIYALVHAYRSNFLATCPRDLLLGDVVRVSLGRTIAGREEAVRFAEAH